MYLFFNSPYFFFFLIFSTYIIKNLKIISERKINQAKEEEQCCSSHFDTDGNSDSSTVLLQTEQNQWFDFIPLGHWVCGSDISRRQTVLHLQGLSTFAWCYCTVLVKDPPLIFFFFFP